MREAKARHLLELLLRIYPRSFRWDVGEDLLATMLDRWREARLRSGGAGEAAFWLRDGLCFGLDGVIERGGSLWMGATNELRAAGRLLVRAPRHYGIAVLTLSLGIGATTAIFAVADAVVFRPLPYPGADRMYLMQTRFGDVELSSNSLPNLLDARLGLAAMEWLAGAAGRSPALTGSGTAERVQVLDVTDDYLTGLSAEVLLGRTFHADDFLAGAERAAILSHALWQRRFGRDPGVLGGPVYLDGTVHTVIGVMQPAFRDPEPIESGTPTGAWVAARVGGVYGNRDYYAFRLITRLAPGTSPDLARQQLAVTSAALAADHPDANRPDGRPMQLVLRPLQDATVGEARSRLLLLLGAVVLLLLLSCANVAGLFLARGLNRSSEMAVRMALGASRSRLTAQLLGESLLTAAAASAVGFALAWVGVEVFRAMAPSGIPRMSEISVDTRVLGFVIVLTLGTAVVFGTLPATRGAAAAIRKVSGSRTTPSLEAQRFLAALLGVEIALSLVLLTGAGLLLNSFRHLLRVDPGFAESDVLVVEVRPPQTANSHDRELQFYDLLAERAAAVPGVQRVALMYSAPGFHEGAWSRATPDHDEQQRVPSQRSRAPIQSLHDPGNDYFRLNTVRGDAFATLGMQFIAGGGFVGDPDMRARLQVVLNEAAARRLFPDDDQPLGRMIRIGEPDTGAPLREVIGVVHNVRQRGLASEPDAQLYLPYGQLDIGRMSLLVRLAAGSRLDANSFQTLVGGIAPEVPVDRIERLSDRYAALLRERRFLTFLLTAFAVLGLLIATIGTYATAAQAAARRRQELGVRAALGATAGSLLLLTMYRTLAVAGAGLALGLLASAVLTRLLDNHLFGVSARDPMTFAVTAALIVLSAAAAAALPALRAARVDPGNTLRDQ